MVALSPTTEDWGPPVLVPLLRGGHALVSECDESIVAPYRWRETRPKRAKTSYAYASVGKLRIAMHRLILNASPGILVDHEDHNGLNNTRRNLRLATHLENNRNVISRKGISRFKGVTWHARAKRWQSQIGLHGRRVFIGNYDTEEDAARAYDAAALRLFGSFARLNFPAEATP